MSEGRIVLVVALLTAALAIIAVATEDKEAKARWRVQVTAALERAHQAEAEACVRNGYPPQPIWERIGTEGGNIFFCGDGKGHLHQVDPSPCNTQGERDITAVGGRILRRFLEACDPGKPLFPSTYGHNRQSDGGS